MMTLRGDETLREVSERLSNAEDYVRGVLGNMAKYRRKSLIPTVRIGTTGQGLVPHYRIQPKANDDDLSTAMESFGEYLTHVEAFNGRNHKTMDWTALQIRGEHWSRGMMTFEEVQLLLGELRGIITPRSNPG